MATIFFTCLQCGEHLKGNHQTIANEVSVHVCQNKFNFVEFQKGTASLQENLKLMGPPPPPPPPMPSARMATKQPNIFSHHNKGQKNLIFELYITVVPGINFFCIPYQRKLFKAISFPAHLVLFFIENLYDPPTPPVEKRMSEPTSLLNEKFRAEVKDAVL